VNREQEDVIDTANGEQLKVKSGSNDYWMDYRGNILGTDNQRPDYGLSRVDAATVRRGNRREDKPLSQLRVIGFRR
jgi:hypothetical protein